MNDLRGIPRMGFGTFVGALSLAIIMLGGATFAYMLLSRDGESTLMEGVQLISLWLLIAVTVLFLYPAA